MQDGSAGVALWVGCYTSDMGGSGEGIVALGRDGSGGYEPLGPATPVASPSFLALHPSLPVLYAVSEAEKRVHAFGWGRDGNLRALGADGSAGPLVCHVAVDSDGAFLVASCWGDGAVVLFELEHDGSLGRRHAAAPSEDPYGAARQSRAHSCLMLGGGRFVTADMGHDLVRCWQFSGERGLEPRGEVALTRGSGPRHFARRSDGVVYVNTEHSVEVAVLRPAAHSHGPWLEPQAICPATVTGARAGDAAAEICLDPHQQHLFVSVRGSNRICRLGLDADGVPSPLEEFGCGGDWPRHHCFDGDRLLVALQRSDAVAVFEPDPHSHKGEPRLLVTGSPTCVLPRL